MASISINRPPSPLAVCSSPYREGRETRTLALRVWHAVQAFFRFIVYSLYKLCRHLTECMPANNPAFIKLSKDANDVICYKTEDLPWNKNERPSDGLFLFVHGYNGSPRRWAEYLANAQEKMPDAHHVVPFIPYRGNCSLEEAAAPVLALAQNYVNKHPGKPLFLFGFSNGGRIVTHLETHLQLPLGSSLTIVSIAGVHHGSTVMSKLSQIAHATGTHPKLIEETSYQSQTSQDLLASRRAKHLERMRDITLRHFFFASTEDEAIQPVSAALPDVNGARYRVIHGHTHASIVYAVQDLVWQDLRLST